MKYLALFALIAGSMLIGACAHKDTTATTTTSSGTGYKK